MTKEKPFEFKKIKEETVFHYKPPVWCSAICRNAYNEVCIEDCSGHRDAKRFEAKDGMNIEDMPRFPLNEFLDGMTPEERKVCIGIYTARLVDQAQGVRHEPKYTPIRRSNLNRSTSSQVPSDIPLEGLLHGNQETVTSLPSEQERQDQTVRPEEVAGTED